MNTAELVRALRRKGRAADEYLTNLSIGGGENLTGVLEGGKQMIEHPIDTGRAMLEGVAQAVRHPVDTARETAGEMIAQAKSGPIGVGNLVTGLLPMPGQRSLGAVARKTRLPGPDAAAAVRRADKNLAADLARESQPRVPGEIESQLVRTKKDAQASAKLRSTPAAVDARASRAEQFLAKPTEPWVAREYAFPRAPIKEALEGWPGVPQTKFPRHQAGPRTDLSHVTSAYDDPRNRQLIKSQILRGLPLGGETFYASLYPIYQEARSRGIPHEDVVKWIEGTSGGSARNTIINEQAVGNALLKAHKQGIDITDPAGLNRVRGEYKQRMGIGLPAMPVHAGALAAVLRGGDLHSRLTTPYKLASDAPEAKLPTYGRNKAGDFRHSATLDVHEGQGQMLGAQAFPYFKETGGFNPAEYGVAEPKFLEIANEAVPGIPGGMAQAGRWMGGGELTGLASPRGDALDMLEKQVAFTLKEKGQDYSPKAVRDYTMQLIQQGGDLAPWFSRSTPMPDVRF